MIVLDTSFLVGLHNASDAHHPAARALQQEYQGGRWGQGILLEYVFVETMTVMMVRHSLPSAIEAGQLLLAAADVVFVPCTGLFAASFALFVRQPGTRLSFTDAAIAVMAHRHAEGNILSFDREFAKLPGLRLWPA